MPRLRRSRLSGPGYTRTGTGTGAHYLDPDGRPVTDAELVARFDALVLPPAWTDVWLCPQANGHIQATGVDAAGRTQYLYHPAWRARMDAIKFDRALDLAEVLPAARGRVRRNLREDGFTRERALAAGFRMLDEASLRVGSEKYALEHGSFGLASLLWRHATVTGSTVALDFPAKSRHRWQSEIVDDDLAAYVRERRRRAARAARDRSGARPTATTTATGADAAAGADETAPIDPRDIESSNLRLLAYLRSRRWRSISPEDINDEVREQTGGDFTAKDFRTLHGTVTVARYLAAAGPVTSDARRARVVAAAMRAAAEVLNNTPAVARASYVDPRVVDQYHRGRTIDPTRNPERELLVLLRG
ncbi:DNA topoisomerase-1 [Salana multivorans]|uniref:DNA topoisomerase n=1 Tax=Salana multivorans TaxID=120377 RepID=A0A3N2DB56_9MICO|nr:DNA topoisomerase IB [Salana multivorans]OJX96089.1 MAG: hypothetical protein BGO96_07355 [Micrococcales bacterium 73-15]ROR97041.1 DNA topoisomerase-1 [Salana multivorans]